MNSYQPHIDLAGEVCFRANFWQTQRRINHLITSYLSDRALCHRLEDLPQQFINPQPRPWQTDVYIKLAVLDLFEQNRVDLYFHLGFTAYVAMESYFNP